MATSQKKGSNAKKNTTAKKSGGSRSGSRNGAKTGAAKKTAQKTAKTARGAAKAGGNKQVGAIALFAVALFFLFVALIPGGNLWLHMQNVLFGLFGVIAYVLPVLLIYVAVITSLDRDTEDLRPKIVETVILIVLICAAVFVFSGDGLTGEFGEDVKMAYLAGKGMPHGGAVGAILGWPLLALFGGKVPAGITLIILIFVVLMIMSGTTLAKLIRGVYEPVQKATDATSEHFEERQLAREERRQQREEELEQKRAQRAAFNPDVELGPKPGRKKSNVVDDIAQKEIDMTNNRGGKQTKAAALKNKISNKIYAFSDDPLLTEEDGSLTEEAEAVTFRKDGKGRAAAGAAAATATAATAKAAKAAEDNGPDANGVTTGESLDDIVKKAAGAGATKKVNRPKAEKIIPDEPFDVESARETVKELDNAAAAGEAAKKAYRLPPLDCLNPPSASLAGTSEDELRDNAERLIQVLQSFGVQTSLVDIARGPSVTRYELALAAGVKLSKITNLSDDIALNLAVSDVRIAPIPGKTAVGIEVPNRARDTVTLREVLESPDYQKGAKKSLLNVALGKDISGHICTTDISKMPHLLIAGTTGSGKSVCVNAMILSILYNAKPDEVKLVMIDPKKVEFTVYNGIPHLLIPVVTEPAKAAGALQWAVREMLNRYKTFSEHNVRDIRGYNKLAAGDPDLATMPQIVIFIDELADLMMATPKEVEDSICRLAQMARAAGMHLVIATQRPSVDVITGLIKSNIPSRLSLSVSSATDSRVILDMIGAEKLLGNGDMLFAPIGTSKPQRIQGCFSTDKEVENVVDFIKNQETTEYDEDILKDIEAAANAAENANKNGSGGGVNGPGGESDGDELLDAAVQVIIEAGQASTSLLQRKLKVGYARGSRIMDELEEHGYIGPYEGSKPRAVLITKQQWLERNAMSGDEDDGTAAAIDMGLDD